VVANLFRFLSMSQFISIIIEETNVNLSLSTPWRQTGGNTAVAALVLNLGSRWDWGVYITPRPHYIRERNLVQTEYAAWWAPERVWNFFKYRKIFPPETRNLDRSNRRRKLTSTIWEGGLTMGVRNFNLRITLERWGRVYWASYSDYNASSFVNRWRNTTILPPAKVRFFSLFFWLYTNQVTV
jgi:hypothetical protein